MNISRILSQLKAERRKLDAAIRALERLVPSTKQSVRSEKYGRKTVQTPAKRSSRTIKNATGKVLIFSTDRSAPDPSREVVSGNGGPA